MYLGGGLGLDLIQDATAGSGIGLEPRSDFEFRASQKSSFSTGFIRFFDTAECHVIYTENLTLLIILDVILRLGPQNHQSSTGFIRFFDTAKRHVVYSEKPNAF